MPTICYSIKTLAIITSSHYASKNYKIKIKQQYTLNITFLFVKNKIN